MNTQDRNTKNCNHRRRIRLWILLACVVIAGLVYFYNFWSAALRIQGTSQAISVLLRRNIPELRQDDIYLQPEGARATGCDLYALEYCATLRVRERILDHPEYLARMRLILEHPCDYAISPHESPARQEVLLRDAPQDERPDWQRSYLHKGEPAWRKFSCDRPAQNRVRLSEAGPRKIVLNVYRPPSGQPQSEIGSISPADKQILQFILYISN
jgi:hypothetical protein